MKPYLLLLLIGSACTTSGLSATDNAAMYSNRKKIAILAQKTQVEIIAVYLDEKGLYVTSVKHRNGRRSEIRGNLGNVGEEFPVWVRGLAIYLSNPNLDSELQ